ncbi:hypothetical protein CMI37_11810 [Candidatus Pacearchaeota archaeon]|nr:hypothetical protein [Candidatus Pacearchaeota archaeon]
MQYKVITTEMWSSTYIVDANSEEEAIQSARLSGGSDDPLYQPIETVYNYTLRDRDSMYVVKLPDYEKGDKVADVVEKWGDK